MADAIDWLSVLQKVFEKYGSQLHKNQVKKFAAKVARKQGRTEDKKHLQKAFKSFLDTETGRNNVNAKDDMLSFGAAAAPSQAQSGAPASAQLPSQARLSLFDLAEAAATLSTASRQALPAPMKSAPTKGKALAANGKDVQQSAPAVPKGQRSARKSKGGSTSPDAEGTPAAAGASAAPAAASSDGMQTRGRATRRPSVEKQPSGRAALPSKPKANADKASKTQMPLPQPGTAHTASAATQDVSPAVSRPEDSAQTLAPVPSTSVAAPSAVSALQEAEGKPKKQKRKHKEEDGEGSRPASQAQALTAAAADGKATSTTGQQDSPSQQTKSFGPSAEAVLAGGAAPSQASAELEAVTGHKKKNKKKRKHSEGLGAGGDTSAAQDAAAQVAPDAAAAAAEHASSAAPLSEAVQGLAAADDTTVKAASKLKKRKKQKHDEVATGLRQSAAPLPAPVAEAADEAADEATVPDAGDPAASQADPGIKPKKKKKSKHSEAADQAVPSLLLGSEAAAAEAGPSDAPAAATAAEASPAQHGAAAPASEPAAAAKPKKRKRKHTDTQAQQSAVAAPSSTRLDAASTKPAANDEAAVKGSQPSEHTAAAHDAVHCEQPAPKAKRKRKSKAPDAVPNAEAGAAPAEEAADKAADEATAEAAGSAAAQKKPRARKSKAASPKDKATISVSALQSSWRENAKRQDVKKGKFTKQEKDTLKAAAIAYAQEHSLPTTDFAWLFSTRGLNSEYKGQATGAWRSISESLPHRTNKAVYACGTRMLHERNYQGKWSKEEDEQLRQLVGEKGSKWAEISLSLNRLAEGCRDRWRELKLGDAKLNGRWNKDETERLRSLVNAYMTQKQANDEERSTGGGGLSLTLDDLESGSPQAEHTQSDGRIILDDIDWDLVSEQHGTRSAAQCLTKWYTQLAPSMVTKGEWGSGDDRRLLRALLKTGAAEDFQVDWGQLVATRTAQQARRRWRLMLKCVKDANDREFSENLEMLVTTFTPDLLLPSSPPKPARARTPKKSKGKEVAGSPAAEYPGMSGGMY